MTGIDAVIEDALGSRRPKLKEIGARVVCEKSHKLAPIATEGLDKTLEQLFDDVAAELAVTLERRLIVRSRSTGRGAQVEIEYTRGEPSDMTPTARHHQELPCCVLDHAESYNKNLRDCGGRFFLSFPNENTARVIIEAPPR